MPLVQWICSKSSLTTTPFPCRIFLLEGGFTVILALIAPFIIVPWPSQAKFLSTDEKKLMQERMSLEVVQYEMNTLNKFSLHIILTDWKVWLS